MARIKCAKCKREKKFLEIRLEGWYRCPKCGPICNDCDAKSGFMGLGDKKCPICGRTLVDLTDK